MERCVPCLLRATSRREESASEHQCLPSPTVSRCFERHLHSSYACCSPPVNLVASLTGPRPVPLRFPIWTGVLFLVHLFHYPLPPRPDPRARFTVALPLANPTPRPRAFRDLNMGAFLALVSFIRLSCNVESSYLSMSGTMNSRTWEPRM